MADVNVKFVSQKISKVRWRPVVQHTLQQSDTFATGSWDNGQENKVCLWTLDSPGYVDTPQGATPLPENEPRQLCDVPHEGDVTDLNFLNQENILAASSTGTVTLIRHLKNSQTLQVVHTWQVHQYPNQPDTPCPCTSLASKGDECVTVGEDGRINVLNLEQRHPLRTIDNADSCAMNAIEILTHSEVLTVNSGGQLKIWDLRQPKDEPSRIFLLTGDRIPLHCVDKHPTQPHIVATGGQDGMLCIWDMRQEKYPITLLDAHSANMWEVKFHPSCPDNLFSCSEDGSVWHWDASSVNQAAVAMQTHGATGGGGHFSRSLTLPTGQTNNAAHSSPWLGSDASKHRIEITDIIPGNIMPINSLDIEANTLLCGSDGEAIYTVRNLVIR